MYVDNSNVWIEGQRVAAVHQGLVPTLYDALQSDTKVMSWKYDFGKLYELACPEGEVPGRTALFGSTPPPSDTIWKIAAAAGFEVKTFERTKSGEKQVDNAIGTMMLEDSYEHMKRGDTVAIVAGDQDFVPNLASVKRRGMTVRVIFWPHASKAIKEIADEFVDLDQHFDYLSLTQSSSE